MMVCPFKEEYLENSSRLDRCYSGEVFMPKIVHVHELLELSKLKDKGDNGKSAFSLKIR